MDHVAIMNKSWKLIDKIISHKKTIESRWYKVKVSPWNKINKGDFVYFKDAGEKVTAKAEVSKVLQFDNLTEEKIKDLINKYGGEGNICFSNSENAFEWAKNKKYCVLIFLENPQRIIPFEIDKKGFGNACAWMTIKNIKDIKL